MYETFTFDILTSSHKSCQNFSNCIFTVDASYKFKIYSTSVSWNVEQAPEAGFFQESRSHCVLCCLKCDRLVSVRGGVIIHDWITAVLPLLTGFSLSLVSRVRCFILIMDWSYREWHAFNLLSVKRRVFLLFDLWPTGPAGVHVLPEEPDGRTSTNQ